MCNPFKCIHQMGEEIQTPFFTSWSQLLKHSGWTARAAVIQNMDPLATGKYFYMNHALEAQYEVFYACSFMYKYYLRHSG